MEDRFGYDGEENIWFDREKPTGEECENRGALFEEILVSEIVEEYESLRTALAASEERVREFRRIAASAIGVCKAGNALLWRPLTP